jgi:hypothetical protein
MTVIVSIETVLLVILVVLVAGLLRSHAEILRRLGPSGPDGGGAVPLPVPPSSRPSREAGAVAPALAGTTPAGDAVSLSFEGAATAPTLLAFLTSGCTTCAGFWETLGEHRLPPGVQTVIVARGSEREQPARLRKLAPVGVPVVMSSPAWDDFDVPGAPYFVLVDGSIRGEGVATSWPALGSLVSDAIADEREAAERRGDPPGRSVDETLAAAGIGPDHPSLYPAGKDPR